MSVHNRLKCLQNLRIVGSRSACPTIQSVRADSRVNADLVSRKGVLLAATGRPEVSDAAIDDHGRTFDVLHAQHTQLERDRVAATRRWSTVRTQHSRKKGIRNHSQTWSSQLSPGVFGKKFPTSSVRGRSSETLSDLRRRRQT